VDGGDGATATAEDADALAALGFGITDATGAYEEAAGSGEDDDEL
jgi:hypothetical protein